MPHHFRPYRPEEPRLLPADLQDWFPENQLAHPVCKRLGALDLVMAGGSRCHTSVGPIEVGVVRVGFRLGLDARLHVRRHFYAIDHQGLGARIREGPSRTGPSGYPSPGVGRRVRLHPVLARIAGRDIPICISQAVRGPVQ